MTIIKFLPIILLVSACATNDPVLKVVTQRVEVPVPIACKADVPAVPDYCFPKLTQDSDIFEKSKCLLSDRKLQAAYDVQLNAALQSCK